MRARVSGELLLGVVFLPMINSLQCRSSAAALAEKAATEENGTRHGQEPKVATSGIDVEEAEMKKDDTHDEPKKMFDMFGLLRYYGSRYKQRTGSIFLDGLVGGMFLAFVLDTSDKCDEKRFINVFFYIGVSHYVSLVLQDMGDYSSAVGALDGVETPSERWTKKILPFLLHFVRLVQYPLLGVLVYETVLLTVGENKGEWTHKREERSEKVKFCEANYLHIAMVTIIFQLIYGLVIGVTWTVLWAVDRDDDQAEKDEEEAWKKAEEAEAGTIWGNIKEFVLVLGMDSFFDEQVASMFLTLALALPHSSCNIHVTEWFLTAGVVFTLTGVINQLREEVQDLAQLDGIINKVEHRLILFLRLINFPLFVVEVVSFVMIVSLVSTHFGNIETTPNPNKPGASNPNFCQKSTWKLMLGIAAIYTCVIVFRIVTIVGSLVSDREDRRPFPCTVTN
jgi:hypothetical protein